SAGSTRVRAGLEALQRAVGWRREDGGGIVGTFVHALAPPPRNGRAPGLPDRVRAAAQSAYEDLSTESELHVNDAVDIAGFLWTQSGELVRDQDIDEGARLVLSLRGRHRRVEVLERKAGFIVRLDIDGVEHPAAVSDSITGPVVKLRIRNAVVSAAICVLQTS